MARVGVLVGAAVALAAVAGVAVADCNIVQVAEAWVHALQTNDAPKLEAFYHRNAIRYDNGKLSELTHGKPVSALQQSCALKRVAMRWQLRELTRNWEKRQVIATLRAFVGNEQGTDMLVSLEFDQHTCLVSVERYFFDPESASYSELIDKTLDECWGDDVDLEGPQDDLLLVRDCIGYADRERISEFWSCFADSVAYTHNGAEDEFYTREFLDSFFNHVDLQIKSVSLMYDSDADIVTVFFNGIYALKGAAAAAAGGAQMFTFSETWRATVTGGRITRLDDVFDDAAFAPALEAMGAIGGLPPVPEADKIAFVGDARSRYPDVVRYYGHPNYVNNVNEPSGIAVWSTTPATALACFSSVVIRNEAVVHTKQYERDMADHFEFLYTYLPVEIDNDLFFDIQRVSRSVMYDYLTRTLIVRGNHLGTNVVSTWLALKLATGEHDLKTVQANLGKGVELSVAVDADQNVRIEDDGSLAYSELFFDMASEICDMARQLNQ